jgi:ABC-type glutathione transport system ATPase component
VVWPGAWTLTSGSAGCLLASRAGGLVLDLRAVIGMRTRSESTSALLDREPERAALDDLLADLRAGCGRAVVVRGEAGVGKSALLEYLAGALPWDLSDC